MERFEAWLYGRVLDVADGRPVTFRTLDVGGDKVLPYVGAFGDDNPAMGWRAIRIGLDRPAMLRRQLRALIQAANGRPLSVMFPMIAEVAELLRARALLDLELERARRRGQAAPGRLRVGVMFEVPALAWQLDSLLPHVDFISVGTNDLLQFLYAADRGNMRVQIMDIEGRYLTEWKQFSRPSTINFYRDLIIVADSTARFQRHRCTTAGFPGKAPGSGHLPAPPAKRGILQGRRRADSATIPAPCSAHPPLHPRSMMTLRAMVPPCGHDSCAR